MGVPTAVTTVPAQKTNLLPLLLQGNKSCLVGRREQRRQKRLVSSCCIAANQRDATSCSR